MKNLPKIELPVDVFAEGFPVDPDFPQLKVASDPQLMLEVFRSHEAALEAAGLSA